MRYFSYRNKLRLRSLLITLLIVLAVLAAVAVGVFLYLQRYIVYTSDGARLDFSTRPGAGAANDSPANPNFVVEGADPLPDAELVVDDAPEEDTGTAAAQLSGVYITAEMLASPAAVAAALDALTGPAAVLMDVKSIYGNYYYNSAVTGAETSSLVDAAAVDELIAALAARNDLYLIARLPAFRDSAYALSNQDSGLPLSSGALWLDADNCYWLNPADDRVLTHLEGIALELQSMGFDEVAFADFSFPDSANIVYDGDRSAAVIDAAKRLSANLSGEQIALSFAAADPALAPYALHVFVSERDGAQVRAIVQSLEGVYVPLENHLVFVTDSRDTRFANYGLLKPAVETEPE